MIIYSILEPHLFLRFVKVNYYKLIRDFKSKIEIICIFINFTFSRKTTSTMNLEQKRNKDQIKVIRTKCDSKFLKVFEIISKMFQEYF